MKKLLLICGCTFPLAGLAQEAPISPPNPTYTVAGGILGTYKALGVQAEVRVKSHFAVKALGVRSFDYGRHGEHGGAGIGLLTFYLPTRHRFLEPLVGVGGVYSWYHWELPGGRGTLHDVNVGGAFGTNFRFSSRLRTGAHLFVGNGFRAEEREGTMTTVGRRLLALPTLTLDVLL